MNTWQAAERHLEALLVHAAHLVEGEDEGDVVFRPFTLPHEPPGTETVERLRDLLAQIPAALEGLEAERSRIATEIAHLNQHRRAAIAYVRSPLAEG